jgi:hypothetical protein
MALGLSQKQLADLVGCAKRTIQRWEDRGATLIQVTAPLVAPPSEKVPVEAPGPADPVLAGLPVETPPLTATGVPPGTACLAGGLTTRRRPTNCTRRVACCLSGSRAGPPTLQIPGIYWVTDGARTLKSSIF